MEKTIKTIIILITMTMFALPSDAFNYDREWKKVESLMEQDLPESAFEQAQLIYRKADAKGDDYQMLRSCVYMAGIGEQYREEYYKEVFDCLNGMMQRLSGIYEPLGWAILGNCYRDYYNRFRHRISGIERLETPSQDVSLWDEQTWRDTIYSCLYKSVTVSAELTASTDSRNLEGLIEPGNETGVRLCPTLLGVLLQNAVDDPPRRERITEREAEILGDRRMYGTAEEFLQLADEYAESQDLPWNVDILARLTRLCADSPDYDVRASADMFRFSLLDYDSDMLPAGLLRLSEIYFEKTSISAQMIAGYADEVFYEVGKDGNELNYAELRALCEKAADRWPDSEGAVGCRSMIQRILEPELTITPKLLSPDASLVGVDCRNVSEVWFRCVRSEDMPIMGGDVAEYRNLRAVAEWKVEVGNTGDYRNKRILVQMPYLPAGKYCLIASSDNLFDRRTTCLNSYNIELHSFSFNACTASNDAGAVLGFVIDRMTGNPVAGAEYSVWELEGPYYDRHRAGCAARGVTKADGSVAFNMPASVVRTDFEIEICSRGETSVSNLYYYGNRSDRPEPIIARIYTDRYTYRPGETVRFNCIVYQNNGYSRGHTVADTDLKITFNDANWQEIETLDITTDKFGTASGSFVIPENLLPGRFTLHIEGADDYFNASSVINVEEFRQPVFMVEMGSDGRTYVPGDTAVVSGTAVTYTGVPVSGAKVSYTVEYVEPRRFMFVRDNDRQILSGETVTGANGEFNVSFLAASGLASSVGRESLEFRVTAKVTDINGETHTAMTYVTAGRAIPYLSVIAEQVYTDAPSLRIMLENAGGDLLEGQVSVSVEKLKPVEEPLLDVTDFFGLHGYEPSDEVRKNFPLYRFSEKNEMERNKARQIEKCVYSTVVSTEAGSPYSLQLPEPLENGTYRVTARVNGVESVDTVFLTSVLPDSRVMPDDRLLLAWPMDYSYKVGDTAEILVGSAFAGTPVYYIIENRFGFVEHGVLYPEGGVSKLKFKVTQEMRGGLTVSCAAAKALVSSTLSVNIDVPYTEKELDIRLVTFRDMLEPDRTETWSISIRDSEGRPVEAALTLSMYDSALDVYGSSDWTFQPWNNMFFAYMDIIGRTLYSNWRSNFSPQMDYPNYDGERAIFPKVVNPLFSYSISFLAGTGMILRGAATKAANIQMEEFEGLGITTVDEALQGRIAGLDVVFNSGDADSKPEGVLNEIYIKKDIRSADDAGNRVLRTDRNPTAFFLTGLRTDHNGEVSFSFTTPQLLTKWNFQGMAHTADLKSAVFLKQVTTRKELMLEPRAPRFVREGDELVLSARLSNVSDADITASVRLELSDAVSGKPLDIISGTSVCDVDVPSGGSAATSFTIRIPLGITAITYRMTAASDSHTDGQQDVIPVLSSRTVVTESVSLFNNGNETRDFELKAVSENLLSESAKDRTLTLEYTPSPIWYAIQALPYLEQEDNPSNERLFHRYFANAISAHIIATRPAVGRMLGKWAEIPADEWQTQLELNSDLKQTLLQETPWVLDSGSEKDNLHGLAQAFAQDRLERELETALKELLQKEEPGGGWAWISGYRPTVWVTNTIVGGIGQLVSIGCLNLNDSQELRDAVSSALHWLDYEIKDSYSRVDRKKVKTVSLEEIDWLLAHENLREIGLAAGTEDIHDFLMNVALKEDTHDMSLYKRASMALLMSATGNRKRAGQIVSTLVERSLYDEEQGRWWRDNVGGYLWHQAPVETQSRIIEALLAAGGRDKEAAECGRWLLKQRQTTHWATSPATAQAVIALLKIGDRQGQSLDNPAVSYITIGGETIRTGGEDTDAGYIVRKWQEPSDPSMGRVSVRNESSEISWGALSIQYSEDMDKVRYSENGISLKRTLYRVDEKNDGTTLHEIAEGESLHVGDRLRIRIELGCDRNMEYVQLKDMRAASFEPVSTRAGFMYSLRDDLRLYVVPQNASQVLYIDRLNRGQYVIEYDVYAEQAGTFSSGIVSAQCMYAPQFRSTAASLPVTVK